MSVRTINVLKCLAFLMPTYVVNIMCIVFTFFCGRTRFAPMFFWSTFEYRIYFDNYVLGEGIVWPFAAILGTLAATVTGLLALWLALGTSHWFLRITPLVFVILMLNAIAAFDLGLVVIVQSIVVIMPLALRRSWNSRFNLRNLMLFLCLVSVLLGFLVQVPLEEWHQWPSILWFGIGFGMFTLVAARIALGPQTFGWRRLLLFFVPYIVLMILLLIIIPPGPVLRLYALFELLSDFRFESPFFLIGLLWIGIAFSLFSLIAARLGLGSRTRGCRWLLLFFVPYISLMVAWLCLWRDWSLQRHSRVAKVVFVGLSGVIVLPVALAYAFLLYQTPIPNESPPVQNGLAKLCQAGESVPKGLFSPFPTGVKNLTTAVKASKASLLQARGAMSEPVRISVNYNINEQGAKKRRAPHCEPLLQVFDALRAEGNLAALEGRINDALTSCADLLHLARCAARGGRPSDNRLAIRFAAIGVKGVHDVRDRMNPEQCRSWMQLLLKQEAAFEPVEIVMQRRYAWVDRVAPWQDRLVLWYLPRVGVPIFNGADDLRYYRKMHLVRTRMLRLELACHLFASENGRYPRDIDALVPTYLSGKPVDPFSGRDIVYRRQDDSFVVYSVGPDKVDNGGVAMKQQPWFKLVGDVIPSVAMK